MNDKYDPDGQGIDRRTVLKGAAAASALGFVGLPAFSGSVAAVSHLQSMTVRSGTDTMVTGYRAGDDAGDFPTSTPNVQADLSWVHEAWSGADHTFDSDTRWIWHCDETSSSGQSVGGDPTYYVKEPVVGDVVELEDTFDIPGSPTSGTLFITADNGYEVSVNGTDVGSAQVFDTTESDWEDSDLGQSFINAQSGSWTSVESIDVSSHLTSGSNTLTVLGGNEQQSTADDESNGTVTSNPGGVIYELDIEYVVQEEFALCAGQDIDVGTVTVTETADGFDVTYTVTDPWTLTETHLDVGDEFGDFHTNKKNNPKVGQFDYSETHDNVEAYTYEISFDDSQLDDVTDASCVLFAAHAVVERAIETEPFYPGAIVTADQGSKKNGDAVNAARSDPVNGLMFESGRDESNFFSLGYGGSIVVKFDAPVGNGPGTDLKVIEDTWGGGYPLETAEIYVSQDGSDWVLLGTADNTQQQGIHTVSEFDLDSAGLEWISYVKVVDTTDPADFTGSGSRGPDSDGYDLNAIEAFYGVQDETAWVCEGEAFTERGNWATYFTVGDC